MHILYDPNQNNLCKESSLAFLDMSHLSYFPYFCCLIEGEVYESNKVGAAD
jgi:hypothetical protein